MKSIAADPNGTDPGEEPESRTEKNKEQLECVWQCGCGCFSNSFSC